MCACVSLFGSLDFHAKLYFIFDDETLVLLSEHDNFIYLSLCLYISLSFSLSPSLSLALPLTPAQKVELPPIPAPPALALVAVECTEPPLVDFTAFGEVWTAPACIPMTRVRGLFQIFFETNQ
jgi:hypothetical protein